MFILHTLKNENKTRGTVALNPTKLPTSSKVAQVVTICVLFFNRTVRIQSLARNGDTPYNSPKKYNLATFAVHLNPMQANKITKTCLKGTSITRSSLQVKDRYRLTSNKQ